MLYVVTLNILHLETLKRVPGISLKNYILLWNEAEPHSMPFNSSLNGVFCITQFYGKLTSIFKVLVWAVKCIHGLQLRKKHSKHNIVKLDMLVELEPSFQSFGYMPISTQRMLKVKSPWKVYSVKSIFHGKYSLEGFLFFNGLYISDTCTSLILTKLTLMLSWDGFLE